MAGWKGKGEMGRVCEEEEEEEKEEKEEGRV